jgi:hypothetical protein
VAKTLLCGRSQPHILVHSPADFRQRLSESEHAVVFVFRARLTPALVVTILFSAARIPGRGLYVPVRRRTNSNVFVSRRNRELSDAQQAGFVGNRFATRVEKLEIVAFWLSRVARLVVTHVSQAGVFRYFARVVDDLDLRSSFFSFWSLGGNVAT